MVKEVQNSVVVNQVCIPEDRDTLRKYFAHLTTLVLFGGTGFVCLKAICPSDMVGGCIEKSEC